MRPADGDAAAASWSGPLGSGRQELSNASFQRRRNRAGVVDGVSDSRHAFDQRQNRGIVLSAVQHALEHGELFNTRPSLEPRTTVVVDAGRLRDRVGAALRHDWDLIGVGAIAEAHDEYDAYADVLTGLVLRQAPPSEIFDYLWAVETQQMGLTGDAVATRRFAEEVSCLMTATE